VPSANTANTANSLVAAEPAHLVGAPGEPAFLSGSENIGSFAPGIKIGPVGFYKDRAGFVHLEGAAKTGKGVVVLGAVPIFALPPGFRPASGVTQIFPGGENSTAIFGSNVTYEGKALDGVVGGAEGKAALLNGIVFRPES
jgi:hypothetical protein